MEKIFKTSSIILVLLACILTVSEIEKSWIGNPKTSTKSKIPYLAAEKIKQELMGSMTPILANIFFLRAYNFWEQKNIPKTKQYLYLSTVMNPHISVFWIEGARIIAYDIPSWTQTQQPDKGIDQIRIQEAKNALNYLDRGNYFHSKNYLFPLEKAQIYLHRLKNLQGALYFYKKAIQQNAPWYVGRIYAELLEQNSQIEEAHEFLKKWYQTLPDDSMNLRSMKGLIFKRIKELEKKKMKFTRNKD